MTESENRRKQILEVLYEYRPQPLGMVPIGEYLARGPDGRESARRPKIAGSAR
jgi:hypothetical protein